MTLRVDVVFDAARWGSVLADMPGYDFVHTFDFHEIAAANGEGEPLLFAIFDSEVNSFLACWPVLKRRIPDSDRFDFSGVYGYGGPLIVAVADANKCFDLIFQAMSEFGAVSLFSRMHPLFMSKPVSDVLRSERLSDVVVIDSAGDSDPPHLYRSAHRYEIRRARRLGVSSLVDFSCERIDDFVSIYHESMRDLSASDYYFFDRSYFSRLIQSSDFKVVLILAIQNGFAIAASLFIVTGDIMQYYLSGTAKSFRNLSPSKLIIAEAHRLALEMGVRKIILGGGVGSSRDALFDFKAGFSDIFLPFFIHKRILDNSAYLSLCSASQINPNLISFFPAYRSR